MRTWRGHIGSGRHGGGSVNPAKTIADSIEEAVDAKIAKSQRGGQKTVTAVYCGKDSDGKPYVQIPGADDTTPIRRMSVQADVGDTVTVTIENGMAVVDSNVSNPSASSSNLQAVEVKATKAQQTADEAVEKVASVARKTETAMAQALSASTIAAEAQEVADATNQHFWDDDNGAHVTDVTQEEWTTALEDNFSDLSTSKPYHNSLFNSLGMLFRSALNNLVSITRSAIAFYDGQGNQSSNIVAEFGSAGVTVGKSADAHMSIDSQYARILHGSTRYLELGPAIYAGGAPTGGGAIRFGNDDLINITSFTNGDLDVRSNNTTAIFSGYRENVAVNEYNTSILRVKKPQYADSYAVHVEVYKKVSDDNFQNITIATLKCSGNFSCIGEITDGSGNVLSNKVDKTESQTANYVFAAPNGSNGAPTFRALVADDLPVVAASKGGTGETTLKDSANALINALDAGTTATVLGDNVQIITQNGNTSLTDYYRRPISKLWEYVKSKIDSIYGLGSFESDSATVSVANTTATKICGVTLGAGTWVVTYTASFASNATGRRNIKLYNGTSTTIDVDRSATCQAVNGSQTVLSRTAIVQPTASTTYYLNAYQASGGALSVDGSVQAVRIA